MFSPQGVFPHRSNDGADVTSSRPQPADPAVVVLGSGITTLGTIRCLGRAGITAYCASDDLGIVASSRWCKRTERHLAAKDELGPFLRQLPFERAVLFPCTDHWVLTAASLEEDLIRRFPMSRAPRAALEILVDKRKTAEILGRLGLPHPVTKVMRSPADLDGVSDAHLAGSFLKPTDSKIFFARYRVKGFSIAGRADAVEKLRQVAGAGFEVVLQEYVPGPPTNHFFIDGFADRTGRVCARFARQRIRMHPPKYGNSSAMISVPMKQVAPAMASLETLLEALEYRGIFSAEFKYDDRDGAFKLLEVNARSWWYVEFAARCGVDVCRMAYDDALERPVRAVDTYRTGAYCVNTRADFSATRRMIRAGEMNRGAALKSFLVSEKVIFHPDDPMPSVSDLFQSVAKWLRGRRPGSDGT